MGLRTWGIAIPPPNPVEPRDSRARITERRNFLSTSSGKSHDFHHRGKDVRLGCAANTIVDSARFDCLFEPRERLVFGISVPEYLGGNADALCRCPFEKLSPVEAIQVVHPVSRQVALFYPAIDSFLGHAEQPRGFLDVDLHIVTCSRVVSDEDNAVMMSTDDKKVKTSGMRWVQCNRGAARAAKREREAGPGR